MEPGVISNHSLLQSPCQEGFPLLSSSTVIVQRPFLIHSLSEHPESTLSCTILICLLSNFVPLILILKNYLTFLHTKNGVWRKKSHCFSLFCDFTWELASKASISMWYPVHKDMCKSCGNFFWGDVSNYLQTPHITADRNKKLFHPGVVWWTN